jgi:XTP/dITP diphosphohydrolase/tetrapyrrole methylase family protein/MazG family protein/ATP diphosphatase
VTLGATLLELQQLTERLRRDCPWDREQTARTIVPHTVEEAYEVADAALADDQAKLLDELGDLLFQVYFLALLLQEDGRRRPRAGREARAREARPAPPARLR